MARWKLTKDNGTHAWTPVRDEATFGRTAATMDQRIISLGIFVMLSTTGFAQSGYNMLIGGGGYDEATAGIARATDGSIYMAGSTASFGTGADFLHRNAYVVKVDPTGLIAWTRAIGGANDEVAWGLAATSDGGCIITGYAQQNVTTDRDLFVVKLSATGSLEWNRNYGGSGYESGFGIAEDGAGGYVVAGTTTSYGWGSSDIYALRLDADGDTLWTKVFGTPYSDETWDMIRTSDGNFVISASMFIDSGSGAQSPALFKIDPDGQVVWDHLYLGESGVFAHISGVIELANGEIQLAGQRSGTGNGDALLIRANATGGFVWAREYQLPSSPGEWFEDLVQTEDGDLIMAGWYSNDFGQGTLLVRVDSSASIVEAASHPAGSFTFDDARIEGVLDNLNGTFTLGGTMRWDDGATTNDFHLFVTGPAESGLLPPCFGSLDDMEFTSRTFGDQALLNPPYAGGQVSTPTWTVGTGGDVNILCDNIGLGTVADYVRAKVDLTSWPGAIQLQGAFQAYRFFEIIDAAGRSVSYGSLPSSGLLNTTALAAGSYTLCFSPRSVAEQEALRFMVLD